MSMSRSCCSFGNRHSGYHTQGTLLQPLLTDGLLPALCISTWNDHNLPPLPLSIFSAKGVVSPLVLIVGLCEVI